MYLIRFEHLIHFCFVFVVFVLGNHSKIKLFSDLSDSHCSVAEFQMLMRVLASGWMASIVYFRNTYGQCRWIHRFFLICGNLFFFLNFFNFFFFFFFFLNFYNCFFFFLGFCLIFGLNFFLFIYMRF